ncbi:10649_t:CDS:2, partial [Cetraspora pellucida]
AMNNQHCSAHKTTPYNLVFGQIPHSNMNFIDMLENNQQTQEPNSSFDNLSEAGFEITIISTISSNDSYLEDTDSNQVLSILQVDKTDETLSMEVQEIIETNNSDSSQMQEIIEVSSSGSSIEVSSSNSSQMQDIIEVSSSDSLQVQEIIEVSSGDSSQVQEIIEVSSSDFLKDTIDTTEQLRYTALEKEKWRANSNKLFNEIRVFDINKLKMDRWSLPCKIIQKRPDRDSYQVACQFEILEHWYPANELEPLGTLNYPALDVVPLNNMISLQQASFKQNIT